MLDKIPRHVEGYQIETLDDEVVLYVPSSEAVIQSNATGALVWGLCDGKRTVSDIIDLLGAAYPDDAATIAIDVNNALADFADHGAVEWA